MTNYVELHCHSNFSLLDGASHPEELVKEAAQLNMPALALTDHDAVYGATRFIQAAHEVGIQPILGAELTLHHDDMPNQHHHLTLLVENQSGWHNLCYLISRAQHHAPKGKATLPSSELIGCTDGLIALSGCEQGELSAVLQKDKWHKTAITVARRHRDLFGRDNYWIELQNHLLPTDKHRLTRLTALANYLNIGTVATNNAHYHQPDRQRLQDVLVCIRHLTTLDKATHLRRLNSEYYLKTAVAMSTLFPHQPQALTNTLHIAERCHFQLSYGLQDLPPYPTLNGMSSHAYLKRLCQQAIAHRYPDLSSRVQAQLNHELTIIQQAGLSNYFLIVWDMVRFARENNIGCQGRGSAANSLVAYLLSISPIDPLAHDLVFERFLSQEQQAIPDIDIDFDAARREEVIQYIYGRYGADHTAMACTFVTFRSRSAIRDIGKALDLSPDLINTAVYMLDSQQPQKTTNPDDQQTLELLLELAAQIEGFPRHLGIHSGGMIITGQPLMGRVPTEPATMPDRVVVQWDKEGLADVGLVKIDILGLRMLSAIQEAVDLIEDATGERPILDVLDFGDTAVYDMIGQADTIGVFQVESRAQAQMLPKLKPRCFNDLIIGISLIRPGPIQGNMVHPFLRRRQGLEPVAYLHSLLKPALEETLGVILFQEQVLKVARDLSGFTAGQGEQLRRALGAKRAEAEIAKFHDAFIVGAEKNGVATETAETIFEQLLAFGGYSFAKSHAAAFAVLVYQSAWLKRYHFNAFYTALLNNQPMGFWNAAVLVNEIRRQGVHILPVDIYHSQAKCTIEPMGIRLGLNYVKGLKEVDVDCLLDEQEKRPFTNLADFCKRTQLSQRAVEALIMAGAMDSWSLPRRQLFWELGTLDTQVNGFEFTYPQENIALPPLTTAEAMLAEQEMMGLSPGDHIMTLYRTALREQHILDSYRVTLCPNGQQVRVAGLLVVHQSPPTAKGFHFLTLEDEQGMMNVIVNPQVYGRYRYVVRTARLLMVRGQVQQQEGVTNILADWVGEF